MEFLKRFSYGYTNKKQFEFTQNNIISVAGDPFATLRVGRGQVEEVLPAMINETNRRMFEIFQNMKNLSDQLREFFMKDAYSFDITDDEALFSYNKFFLSYLKTFKRLNLIVLKVGVCHI